MSSEAKNAVQLLYGQVLTPRGIRTDGVLAIQGENIAYAGDVSELPASLKQAAAEVIHQPDGYIVPGFIDIHVHGGNGEDFMDATKDVLDQITSFHSSQGTTAMLATTMTAPKEAIDRVLKEVSDYRNQGMSYTKLEGVHLEGPFISPKWPGAQNPEHIVHANIRWLEEWVSQYPGLVRQVTLAPEREGALEAISWLDQHGIVAALGHTDATYEEVEAAVEAGLSHGVHTFNAMTGLHHRKPGVVGAMLSDDRLSCEIIADGIHVHPAAIRILARMKQDGNLILITDAMSATGMTDGEYTLGDLPVVVEKGIATLKHNRDSLAGSTLTMIKGFQLLVREVGLSIEQASTIGSMNPARKIGIADRTGSLEAGKLADILVLSSDLELQGVWIQGQRKH
ncbi:N-acetylglucosamine-6-phosphate deacetylase [Paenibacillus glucanolyticus]|jgi:N-acetylglucosamine-6-phosphate deacetylase|uniref:N-acetylglucosamine-6-phosphate deacetylase n=1 Tax=Paenibacillus TaxID=44249 RepID=UPI0003E26AA0|nr:MULTISPECIES: N-acetylglucosamine-6-phosphate deacetylase [Paenibacillus]ANA81353.1 N-acetylglucosamine-6-phosphate deacetylase [Paenibacillus glucanolyticus]AVV59917.1 N-acetylglucosamine-6-phosphate deacetylase [Paenibacillus glucanolyticus]ETT35589.1 N-acetylglucosamine-6-phosphate deacetylase [Paenibacillus sp. FSL R5-808]OMF72178.1 N-acetylglucosamine-6-phosphate deacetylase [Paenibacillus glucanolyticus]